jgi:pimeloyl-ACP methyl ester carboxylesterase
MVKLKNKSKFIIDELVVNGLEGRMLRHPSRSRKYKDEILLIYGHHASLERMLGLAEVLARYGNVTMPDLPGFGGMDSFDKIGERPSIDRLADYLASFIKMRYKRKKVRIIGMSFGFVVVVRMLQKYPDLVKKTDELVSMAGFVHKDDFKIKARNKLALKILTTCGSPKISAFLVRHMVLRKSIINATYNIVAETHSKLIDATPKQKRERIDFEVKLWQMNDVRTAMITGKEMLKLDLCSQRLPMSVHHIFVKSDRYFENDMVEQHLNVIFDDVSTAESKLKDHAPTVAATAKDAAPFIPSKTRKLLAN